MRVNEVQAGEASAILPDFPLSRALGDPVPSKTAAEASQTPQTD